MFVYAMGINKIKGFSFIILLFLTSFFGTLFLLFPCYILLFVNRKIYHTAADFFIKCWLTFACFLIEKFCRINIHLHTKNKIITASKNTNTIVVMNHRTRLDWLFYFCILYRLNGLDYIKVILKKELKNIWGAGWAMQFGLFIFLFRKWETDSEIITTFISYYKAISKNVWILIFPEGTNLTQNTKEKSDEFAKKNNVETYDHVLHPRVAGFMHLYNEMKRNSMIDYIHDVTVAYDSPTESEKEFLYGNFPKNIHFYIESIDCKTETINDNWLVERWKTKEQFLKTLDKSSFQSPSHIKSADLGLIDEIILCIYGSMWFLYLIFVFYSLYSYLMIKIYVLFVLLFFVFISKRFNGLDNFVIKKLKIEKIN